MFRPIFCGLLFFYASAPISCSASLLPCFCRPFSAVCISLAAPFAALERLCLLFLLSHFCFPYAKGGRASSASPFGISVGYYNGISKFIFLSALLPVLYPFHNPRYNRQPSADRKTRLPHIRSTTYLFPYSRTAYG